MNVTIFARLFCQKVYFCIENFQNNPRISSANHLWQWQLQWVHCYTQPLLKHTPFPSLQHIANINQGSNDQQYQPNKHGKADLISDSDGKFSLPILVHV